MIFKIEIYRRKNRFELTSLNTPQYLLHNKLHLINITFHIHSRLFHVIHIQSLSKNFNHHFKPQYLTIYAVHFITHSLLISISCNNTTIPTAQNIHLHSIVHTLKSTTSAFHFITHSLLQPNITLQCYSIVPNTNKPHT